MKVRMRLEYSSLNSRVIDLTNFGHDEKTTWLDLSENEKQEIEDYVRQDAHDSNYPNITNITSLE